MKPAELDDEATMRSPPDDPKQSLSCFIVTKQLVEEHYCAI
jgi:hypothetical protein